MQILQHYQQNDPTDIWPSGKVESDVYICPADSSPDNYLASNSKLNVSYKQCAGPYMTYAEWKVPHGQSWTQAYGYKLNNLKDPCNTAQISESQWPHWGEGISLNLDANGICADIPAFGTGDFVKERRVKTWTGVHLRHVNKNGVNGLFADSHVKTFVYPVFDVSFERAP